MARVIASILLLSISSFAEGQKSSLLWREDGRCGEQFPLPNGQPGQCDPEGDGPRKGPCCSPKGFCGNTVKHCDCSKCTDYSWKQFATEPEKPVNKPKNKPKVTKANLKKQPLVEKTLENISEDETVQTRSGAIKGKLINGDGFSHYQFLGIPYAKPPVGSLRFRPPVPVRPWTKTLEADKKGPECYQQNDLLPDENAAYSEDCLHLNIYTEDMNHTAKPVMVWIHGGGFILGSGNKYAPLPGLLKEGVIVVTINYRLASLGFLTFGNDVVSGNMGLKDQALAIQWVKQNIRSFGGNPNKITIFGESAGGVSVHAHVLSPWNFGQIQGAIAHSGTMLLYNHIKSFGEREEIFAKDAATKLGCDEDLNQRTLDCMQGMNIEDIMKMLKNEITDGFLNNKLVYEWRPVIDNYASNPFLPLDPLEAMQTGVFNQIPFMSGTVKNDGAIILPTFALTGKTTKEVKENWGSLGPAMMYSSPNHKVTEEDSLFANITMKYYNHPQGDSALEQDQPLLDILSDSVFISPDQKTVQMMSKHSQHVFNYYLTQQTDKSFIGPVLQLGPEYSPMHGDDLIFLLENYGQKLKFSEEESALSKLMIKYWTNFAKFGHPTPSVSEDLPHWDAVTEESHNYLELKAVPHMEKNLLAERMHYWDKMMWAPKIDDIEKKVVYTKATQFLLGRNY